MCVPKEGYGRERGKWGKCGDLWKRRQDKPHHERVGEVSEMWQKELGLSNYFLRILREKIRDVPTRPECWRGDAGNTADVQGFRGRLEADYEGDCGRHKDLKRVVTWRDNRAE